MPSFSHEEHHQCPYHLLHCRLSARVLRSSAASLPDSEAHSRPPFVQRMETNAVAIHFQGSTPQQVEVDERWHNQTPTVAGHNVCVQMNIIIIRFITYKKNVICLGYYWLLCQFEVYLLRILLATRGLSTIWCVMVVSFSSNVAPGKEYASHETCAPSDRNTKVNGSRGTSRLRKTRSFEKSSLKFLSAAAFAWTPFASALWKELMRREIIISFLSNKEVHLYLRYFIIRNRFSWNKVIEKRKRQKLTSSKSSMVGWSSASFTTPFRQEVNDSRYWRWKTKNS